MKTLTTLMLATVTGLSLNLLAHAADDGQKLLKPAQTAMETRCAGCHKAELGDDAGRGQRKASKKWAGPSNLQQLRDEYIFEDGKALDDPTKSMLVLILHDPEEPMPPKRSRGGPLTDDEMAAILAWVKAGAPLPAAN